MRTTIVLLALLVPAAALAAEGDVSVFAEIGFNAEYRIDSFTQIRVTVSNAGDDRSATVIVATRNQTGGRDRYTAGIEIPRNSIKQLEFTVLLGSGQDIDDDSGKAEFDVIVADQEGKKLADAKVTANAFRNDLFVVYAGPACKSIADMGIASKQGKLVRTGYGALPSDPNALEGVDALILGEPGENLREHPSKAAALREYVRGGGLLICWDRPQNFSNPLPAWRGLAPEISNETPEIVDPTEGIDAVFVSGASAPRLHHLSGAPLIRDREGALALEVREGTGCAVFLSWDPNDALTVSAPRQERIFAAIYDRLGRKSGAEEKYRGDWISYSSRSVCDVDAGRPVSHAVFVALFAAFAIIAGPGVTLAVGRRRRPLVWVLVPLVSAGFAAASYLFATSGRQNEIRLHQVTFADVCADGSAGSFDAVAGLFTPGRGTYELEYPGSTGCAGSFPSYMDHGWRYQRTRLAGVDTHLEGGLSFMARMNPYSVRPFRVSGELPPRFLARIRGGFSLTRSAKGWYTLENRSSVPIARGWVIDEVSIARFGRLDPGEKAQLIDDHPLASMTLDLGLSEMREKLAAGETNIDLPGVLLYSREFPGWCPFERRVPPGDRHALIVALTTEQVAGLTLPGFGLQASETAVILTTAEVEDQ